MITLFQMDGGLDLAVFQHSPVLLCLACAMVATLSQILLLRSGCSPCFALPFSQSPNKKIWGYEHNEQKYYGCYRPLRTIGGVFRGFGNIQPLRIQPVLCGSHWDKLTRTAVQQAAFKTYLDTTHDSASRPWATGAFVRSDL